MTNKVFLLYMIYKKMKETKMKTKTVILLAIIFSFSVNAHESICVTKQELDKNYSKKNQNEPEYLVYTYKQLNTTDVNKVHSIDANHIGRKYIRMDNTCMKMPKNNCGKDKIPLFIQK